MKRSSAIAVRGDLIRVGIFAVIGVVIITLLGIQLSGTQFNDESNYAAAFTDVSGLRAGDEVRAAGVRVGSVEDIALADGVPRITFTVDKNVSMTDDVHAAVRYKNLIGDRYLELSKAGESIVLLAPGATIPATRTSPALDLDSLLNGFQPLFQGLQPDQINQLSQELITVLQGEGGTIQDLLGHIGSLTSTLADRDQVIGSVITNMNSVLGTVNQHGSEFSVTLSRLQQLVSGLAADRQVLGSSLDRIASLTGSFNTMLEQVRPSLRSTVDQFGRTITNVDADKGELDQNLKDLVDFYTRASRIGAYGSFTNAYLCGLQIKLTGPDGKTIYTPWIDSNSSSERCRDN
ncbi:MCE family protein [Amycolatopsis acidiphila]|uniref:MCE family protein n=1 Tax=Amycolatopsis acidiphila TaxID=715473 RepID=A0A558AI04_9PSEU|nr:MCE family protein [Amycolatopsis acidiphila]TVT23869.1 MCE family protein [Amycolatopsis acidiphila]UIJ61156.1 MCE family protein [Amycolatopsis acidiphila]GHG86386.1 mammalian cell entry protein [Amycolatopsis acidiphila]